MNIFIIGGGTLCKFVIDIVESLDNIRIEGIFDDNYPQKKSVNKYPVIGKISDIATVNKNLVLAIGDPAFRKSFISEKTFEGHTFPIVTHASTIISKYAEIGAGNIIGPYSSVLGGSTVGAGCCILSNVNINHDIEIGTYSLIGAGCLIGNNVKIGEGAHLSMGVNVPPEQIIEPWALVEK